MIEITDITSNGMGVGRTEGMVVFVPETVTGEKVEIEIISKQKTFCNGKVTNIIEKSPHRRQPLCSYYGKCGGCNLMHMDYDEQLRVKENIVHNAIARIGKVDAVVNPIIGAKSETGYRNKAAFPVKNGKIGYYMSGSHSITEIDSCPMVKDEINRVLKAIKPFVKEFGHSINHVVVRSTDGKTMVTVVTDKKTFKFTKELISVLSPLQVESISVNYCTSPKHILGSRTDTIYGDAAIPYTILGNTFKVSPTAFLQVNDKQAERLYQTAISSADIAGSDLIDAYCGTGTISLALAKEASSVTGIEINPASIENARGSAKANGITNAEFICGKCEDVIPKLLAKQQYALVADPPRAGMEKSLIETIADSGIPKLVYISCDPSTLARDIGRLSEYGYKLQSVTPVDMFPNTAHVENVAVIKKANNI